MLAVAVAAYTLLQELYQDMVELAAAAMVQ
jgi:hypothetical protein